MALLQSLSKRLATAEDKEFLRKLHHAAYKETVIKQFGVWDEDDQDLRFNNGLEGKKYTIIQKDNIDIGAYNLEDIGDHYFLAEIQILPEYQSQGYGNLIMKSLIAALDKPLKLQVLKKNSAHLFYKKLGFEPDGETETHFKMVKE